MMTQPSSLTPSPQRLHGPSNGAAPVLHHHHRRRRCNILAVRPRRTPSGHPRQSIPLPLKTDLLPSYGNYSSKAPPHKFCPSLFLGDRRCPPMCTRWKSLNGTCCILVAAIQCPLGAPEAGGHPGLLATLNTGWQDTLVGALLLVTGDQQSTALEECCLLPSVPSNTVSVQADHPTHHHLVVCQRCLASLVCHPLPEHQDLSMDACHQEIIHLASEAGCQCLLCPTPC